MSEVFKKRTELEKLKQKVRSISLDIECAEKSCRHNWTISSYEELYNTGSIELSPIIILSDGTSIIKKPTRETTTRKVWVRNCTKCGKQEETRKKYASVFEPIW